MDKENAAPEAVGHGADDDDRQTLSPTASTAPAQEPIRRSRWRQKYRVHPAADVFPMMLDDELDALGKDIEINGLKAPLSFCWVETGTPQAHRCLIDGRNRLQAMERVGIRLRVEGSGLPGRFRGRVAAQIVDGDPVSLVKSLNLHRRHMLKSERAEAIVALAKMSAEKPDHGDPVSKGGRGKKNEVKAKALEINAALPEEQRVSEPTLKRAFRKAKTGADLLREARVKRHIGKRQAEADKHELKHDHQVKDFLDATKAYEAALAVAAKSVSKFAPEAISFTMRRLDKIAAAQADLISPFLDQRKTVPGKVPNIETARGNYLLAVEQVDDLDVEQRIINDGFREIAGKRLDKRRLP